MAATVDLEALVRAGSVPVAASLRGLDGQWRAVERSIAGEFAAAPRVARRLVESFARLAARCGEDDAVGRAARLRGSYLVYVGRYAQSIADYERAVRMLDGIARESARLGLAGSLLRSDRADAAVKLCRIVRRAAARIGDAALAARADLNEATALHESGAVAASLPLYRRARSRFHAAGDVHHEALAAQNLANALVLLDRHDEAAPLYAAAAGQFESLGLAHDAARLRYNRGALLVGQDRLGDAERELAESERELTKAGDGMAASLARLDRGEALLRAGLVTEASRVLDSAARGLSHGAPANERFRARWLRARAAIARGEFAAARRIVGGPRKADAWGADRDEVVGLALAGERRFAEARRALESAATRYGAARPASRARAVSAAGWCALESGDVATARRHAVRAARFARRLPMPSLVHAAAALRFVVEDEAGRSREAASALRTALSSLERTRNGLGPDAMRSAVLRGRERWFARAVRHVLDGPRGEVRALALVERWRARALVELMASSARIEDRGGRLAELRARVAVLERRLEGAGVPYFLRSPAVLAAPRLARELAAAERRLHDAVAREVRAGPGAGFSLERLRAAMPAGTALLSCFADELGALAFVVGDRGVRVVRLDVRESEIGSLAEELYFRCGKYALGPEFVAGHRRRLAAETDRILAALAARTLDPIADAIDGAQRLVVAPHGAWHQVPFAALPFRGGRLIDSMSVAMTPSLGALAARVPQAAGRPVVLAVCDGTAPTIASEARAVAATCADALSLEGADATSAALRAAASPRFVHVASHGRFRADAPGMSGVRLADGWLRAVDFHSLALDGSLVVLSGCETGVSHVDPGGEIQGLVRGVLSSGAAELVVSLWRVDDAATAGIMSRFHEMRAAGAPTDAALAAAQREAAASGLSAWYWAGFGVWTRRLGA